MVTTLALTRARFTGHRYTIDELNAFQLEEKDVRFELLDGHLVLMPMTSRPHQHLSGSLFTLIHAYVAAARVGSVYIEGEIHIPPGLIMKPDVLVLPDRHPWTVPWEAITKWWLAVEVLSPTNRDSDLGFKRGAYLELGIPLVWLVDPDARTVRVARPGLADVTLGPPAVLTWHAPGAPEPLTVDLTALFADD